jgi:hypothetical protein
VVTINEEGWLSVIYLGAEPPKARFNYSDSRDENYEELLKVNRVLKGRFTPLTQRKGKLAQGAREQPDDPTT